MVRGVWVKRTLLLPLAKETSHIHPKNAQNSTIVQDLVSSANLLQSS